MKVLISDYSSDNTTEPLYFNAILNSIDCKSTLWPDNTSTFDIFDIVQPDIHITHHSKISKDLVIYLQQSSRKIDLIVNITGMNQENVRDFIKALNEYNIDPALLFVNHYDHNIQTKKTNIISILHSADVFLKSEQPHYNIEYGIIINNENQVKPLGQTYHYITNNKSLEKNVDILLPIGRLAHLYNNYKNILFRYFDKEVPQIFFDAAYRNNSVLFDLEDRTLLNGQLKKLLGEENLCDPSIENSGDIREKIKQKHTCLHRVKSLLSQLPAKEYIDKLERIIEKL